MGQWGCLSQAPYSAPAKAPDATIKQACDLPLRTCSSERFEILVPSPIQLSSCEVRLKLKHWFMESLSVDRHKCWILSFQSSDTSMLGAYLLVD